MKEIGKLIELYYEHKLDLLKREMRVNGATEREIEMADIEKVEEEELEENLNKLSDLKPFIKWLVENDKIGDNKNSDRYTMMKLMRAEINEGTEVFEGTERYEFVIMLLSIQDNPIEFLVSILK